jgi:hypothetical protein
VLTCVLTASVKRQNALEAAKRNTKKYEKLEKGKLAKIRKAEKRRKGGSKKDIFCTGCLKKYKSKRADYLKAY